MPDHLIGRQLTESAPRPTAASDLMLSSAMPAAVLAVSVWVHLAGH